MSIVQLKFHSLAGKVKMSTANQIVGKILVWCVVAMIPCEIDKNVWLYILLFYIIWEGEAMKLVSVHWYPEGGCFLGRRPVRIQVPPLNPSQKPLHPFPKLQSQFSASPPNAKRCTKSTRIPMLFV